LAERKKPEFYAILTSLITGIGIDSWLFLLGNWVNPVTWLGQSVCLGLGIIFTGMGVASYLQSNFAPNPMDRSMLVVKIIPNPRQTDCPSHVTGLTQFP